MIRGLKDHEIQELINVLSDELKILTDNQSLRERIAIPMLNYLEKKNLRIDKKITLCDVCKLADVSCPIYPIDTEKCVEFKEKNNV
jgi:hypothetical protein